MTGTVYTFTTVVRQGREFAPRSRPMSLPYTIVVVEPDAVGPVARRVAGWVAGGAPENGIVIGVRVGTVSTESIDPTGVEFTLQRQ